MNSLYAHSISLNTEWLFLQQKLRRYVHLRIKISAEILVRKFIGRRGTFLNRELFIFRAEKFSANPQINVVAQMTTTSVFQLWRAAQSSNLISPTRILPTQVPALPENVLAEAKAAKSPGVRSASYNLN
jgi:hypothetical protein